MASIAPPGGNGTTIRNGRSGQESQAGRGRSMDAAEAAAGSAAAKPKRGEFRCLVCLASQGLER